MEEALHSFMYLVVCKDTRGLHVKSFFLEETRYL
jgi:hypothetical protein